MEEILEECKSIIDEVCEKYNYNTEDKDGNDSLKTVLLKAVPAMLVGRNENDRKLFYQMLRHTPIVVTENLTQEKLDKIEEEYIGDINSHIKEEELDLGEYNTKKENIDGGAYVSSYVLDENMNLIGKKSFLYVQKVSDKAREFLGTDINVSHLIHELGHSWHAEHEQFKMTEDGNLIERVGTAVFKHSFSKNEDGTFTEKNEKVTGLFIEEGMNTIAEEKAMANYIGIPLEEMKKRYNDVLLKSEYQGLISSAVDYLLGKNFTEDLENWRLYGDEKGKEEVEKWIEKASSWKNLKNNKPLADKWNYEKKRDIISQIDSEKVQGFFEKYEDVYFPDVSKMTPIEKLENSLTQIYNLKITKYSMGKEKYSDFVDQMLAEYYALINDAENEKSKETKIGKEDFKKVCEQSRVGSVQEATTVTKNMQRQKEDRNYENEK